MARETDEQQKRLYSKLSRELGPAVISILEEADTTEICVNSDGCIWTEGKDIPLDGYSLDYGKYNNYNVRYE